jgi:ribonuclease P protein subunit RPR2
MSKVKPLKSKGIPSKHLHARTTFIYQAATYLTLQTTSDETADATTSNSNKDAPARTQSQRVPSHSPLALQLGSDLQQVSRKAQLRLSVDLKRTLCKRCNTVLVPGRTASQTIENASKKSKKPWADVLVLTCGTCEGRKRFPVGSKRQGKKNERKVMLQDTTSNASLGNVRGTESASLTSTELDSNTG